MPPTNLASGLYSAARTPHLTCTSHAITPLSHYYSVVYIWYDGAHEVYGPACQWLHSEKKGEHNIIICACMRLKRRLEKAEVLGTRQARTCKGMHERMRWGGGREGIIKLERERERERQRGEGRFFLESSLFLCLFFPMDVVQKYNICLGQWTDSRAFVTYVCILIFALWNEHS